MENLLLPIFIGIPVVLFGSVALKRFFRRLFKKELTPENLVKELESSQRSVKVRDGGFIVLIGKVQIFYRPEWHQNDEIHEAFTATRLSDPGSFVARFDGNTLIEFNDQKVREESIPKEKAEALKRILQIVRFEAPAHSLRV